LFKIAISYRVSEQSIDLPYGGAVIVQSGNQYNEICLGDAFL